MQCVYCNEPATTRDHVPPKSLFPRLQRKTLLTVPACEACNRNASLDEDYFRAVLLLGTSGETPAGEQVWRESLTRTYSRKVGLRRRMESSVRYTTAYSPAGLAMGFDARVRFEDARFQNVLQKIVRRLYFAEYGVAPSRAINVLGRRLHNEALLKAVTQVVPSLQPGTFAWNGVFRYRFKRREAAPEGSMWLLHFYDAEYFWVVTGSDELFYRAQRKAQILYEG